MVLVFTTALCSVSLWHVEAQLYSCCPGMSILFWTVEIKELWLQGAYKNLQHLTEWGFAIWYVYISVYALKENIHARKVGTIITRFSSSSSLLCQADQEAYLTTPIPPIYVHWAMNTIRTGHIEENGHMLVLDSSIDTAISWQS